MLIDRTGEIAERWTRVEEPPLPDGPVIVPLAMLGEVEPASRRDPLGVDLPNNVDAAEVLPRLAGVELVSVDFPAFNDGRGFSIARRLRALGYAGRLRAAGPVIADQFTYLLECGFDEVEVPEHVALRQPAEMWLAQLDRIGLGYQRGRIGRLSILDQRRAARGG